jgi:hypothetical protein
VEAQGVRDSLTDLLLYGEDIAHRAFVALGPGVEAVFHGDQLHGDTQPVARFADAALEHVNHAEAGPHLTHIGQSALEMKAGGARSHLQPLHLGEVGDQLLRDPIAEILLISLRAEVDEGQHGDGALLQCSTPYALSQDELSVRVTRRTDVAYTPHGHSGRKCCAERRAV